MPLLFRLAIHDSLVAACIPASTSSPFMSSVPQVAPVPCTPCRTRRWRPASGCTLARPELGTGRPWWTSELRSGCRRASISVPQVGSRQFVHEKTTERGTQSGKPSHTFRTCNARGRCCFNARDRVATTCCARCHQPSQKSMHRSMMPACRGPRRFCWEDSLETIKPKIGRPLAMRLGRLGLGSAQCVALGTFWASWAGALHMIHKTRRSRTNHHPQIDGRR